MSVQIRAQVEADDSTQNFSQSAETPLETNAINSGTGREVERASAEPTVVRTLKNPPEIWDLVHEAPVEFNPGGAFVARLTSSKTSLILLTAIVFIAGLGAYAVMTLRDGRKLDGVAAQVEEERGTSQNVPSSQASAPATAPVNAPVEAPVPTSPGAEASVNDTPPQPTDSQPTDSQSEDPQQTDQPGKVASADNAISDSTEPTGVSVSNISTGAVGAVAALSENKRGRVGSGRQIVDKPRPARGESETAVVDTSAESRRSEGPQTAELKPSQEKSAGDSSAQRGSNKTQSPPSIAPPPATSTAPKAKVIQWP